MGDFFLIHSAPDPDGKIRHYRNLYLNRPVPIDFLPLAVDTSGRLYDYFILCFSCMFILSHLI